MTLIDKEVSKWFEYNMGVNDVYKSKYTNIFN